MADKNVIDDQDFDTQGVDAQDSSYDESYDDDQVYADDDSSEWADESDFSEEDSSKEENQPSQKKKTSPLTVIIILVVAIVGVFGVMLLKGNKSSVTSSEQGGEVALSTDVEAPLDAESPSGSSPVVSIDQGLPTHENAANPDKNTVSGEAQSPESIGTDGLKPAPSLVSGEGESGQGVMENPSLLVPNTNVRSPESARGDDPVAQPSSDRSADVVKAISPTVTPVSDFPTVDSIKKPDIAQSGAVETSTAKDSGIDPGSPSDSSVSMSSGPTPVLPVPTSAAQQTATVDLKAQLEEARSKIQVLEKQLSEQSAELEIQKKKNISNNEASSRVTSAKQADGSSAERSLPEGSPVETPVETKSVVPERNHFESRSIVSPRTIVKKPVQVSQPKPLQKKRSWILKSAGAGKAILSDKATGDLKTVRIGDSVPGLGRIISISMDHSSWVVKGTSGFVRE